MSDNEFIVTTGEMEFKEVSGKDRMSPFNKPGQTIKTYLGYKIDYCDWNKTRKYRIWLSGDEIVFYQYLEQCEEAIIKKLCDNNG